MRKLLGIILLFAASAAAQTITAADREKAINHLTQTREAFLASIKGLSAEQWSFKPAPEVWSVAEVAEHITLSESSILELLQKKVLAAPADPALLEKTKGKDDDVLRRIADRTEKAKAPPFLQPQGRWTQDQIPAEFNNRRDKTIEFVRTTEEDLRGHAMGSPAGRGLDGYQLILLISAHSQRHTAQIDEVKAHPNFPKK